ncbi:hypothetical protein IFM89_010255 [Coptis chinensis]|uniref:DUF8039 domain-containing protein n=1 Tax=Coptis chinensis TaxID=261450 RepID=A0A835I794_9MAGN|nr:hypothetical protein IFM89_010255 [Coptis chinensis]
MRKGRPNNARVSVDKILEGKDRVALPIPFRDELVILKDALGSQVAWPKHSVLKGIEGRVAVFVDFKSNVVAKGGRGRYEGAQLGNRHEEAKAPAPMATDLSKLAPSKPPSRPYSRKINPWQELFTLH